MLILLGKLQNLIPRAVMAPKLQASHDARSVEKHLEHPVFAVYDPAKAAEQFPDRRVPAVPGAPPTTGLEQIAYGGQPTWDRSENPCAVGPVREFFARAIAAKNSVKQV